MTKAKTLKTTPKTRSFIKKAFGEEKKIILQLNENDLPETRDKDGKLIQGIPADIFKHDDKKASSIAKLEYQKECAEEKIASLETQIEKTRTSILELDAKIDEVKTGKKSKKSLEAKRAKMLAALAELDAELEVDE